MRTTSIGPTLLVFACVVASGCDADPEDLLGSLPEDGSSSGAAEDSTGASDEGIQLGVEADAVSATQCWIRAGAATPNRLVSVQDAYECAFFTDLYSLFDCGFSFDGPWNIYELGYPGEQPTNVWFYGCCGGPINDDDTCPTQGGSGGGGTVRGCLVGPCEEGAWVSRDTCRFFCGGTVNGAYCDVDC